MLAIITLSAPADTATAVAVGAMGDSYSDEFSPGDSTGFNGWTEILIASGDFDFGPVAAFPFGDPRNPLPTGGGLSSSYNFARQGANAASGNNSDYLDGQHTNPAQPDGIQMLATAGTIEYVSHLIGGNDILGDINFFASDTGIFQQAELNQIFARYKIGLDTATGGVGNEVKPVLVTYPDIGHAPLVAFTLGLDPVKLNNVTTNTQYYNDLIRAEAATNGYPVVEMWDVIEDIKANGLTVHGIIIDPNKLPGGALTDMNSIWTGDGIHPTPIIHALWANEFIDAIITGYGEDEPGLDLLTSKELVTLSGLDPQQDPTADAGAGYMITEGDPLMLDASASSDPNPGDLPFLMYRWDLNGDGLFNDAFGVQPAIVWNDLQSLGLGPRQWDVRVQVDDTFGGITESMIVALEIEPLPPPILGDVNSDGIVDDLDVTVVSMHFGLEPATLAQGDANNDGRVDGLDVNEISANYGASNGFAAPIPEPSSLLLLMLYVPIVLRSGRPPHDQRGRGRR